MKDTHTNLFDGEKFASDSRPELRPCQQRLEMTHQLFSRMFLQEERKTQLENCVWKEEEERKKEKRVKRRRRMISAPIICIRRPLEEKKKPLCWRLHGWTPFLSFVAYYYSLWKQMGKREEAKNIIHFFFFQVRLFAHMFNSAGQGRLRLPVPSHSLGH